MTYTVGSFFCLNLGKLTLPTTQSEVQLLLLLVIFAGCGWWAVVEKSACAASEMYALHTRKKGKRGKLRVDRVENEKCENMLPSLIDMFMW